MVSILFNGKRTIDIEVSDDPPTKQCLVITAIVNIRAPHCQVMFGSGYKPKPSTNQEQEQDDEYERGLLPVMTSDEVAMEITIENTCCICDWQYDGSTKCSRCQEYCHDSMACSEGGIGAIMCQLCIRENDMENQRSVAHSKHAKQVEKGQAEFRNILGGHH